MWRYGSWASHLDYRALFSSLGITLSCLSGRKFCGESPGVVHLHCSVLKVQASLTLLRVLSASDTPSVLRCFATQGILRRSPCALLACFDCALRVCVCARLLTVRVCIFVVHILYLAVSASQGVVHVLSVSQG